MRTLIRNQMLEPIAIPNNMISDYIIVNESRLGLSKVLQDFAVRPFPPDLTPAIPCACFCLLEQKWFFLPYHIAKDGISFLKGPAVCAVLANIGELSVPGMLTPQENPLKYAGRK